MLADHTSIISGETMLGIVNDLYVNAFKQGDLETIRANAQYAFRCWSPKQRRPGNRSRCLSIRKLGRRGTFGLAIEVNAKALAAMGYQPSDVARIASAAFDPTERARLYAVAASSTKELSQRLTWVADITRSSYEAAHFQDAIRSAEFLATAAEMELPRLVPKAVSLQKAAQEVQGWAYLRTGDREMFDEFASS